MIPRPHRDRQQCLYEHETALLNYEFCKASSLNNDRAITKQTTITGESHSSKKSLSELKPILLSQMAVPVVHKGCYLVCRTITEACVTVATCTLIEDLREDVESMFLYNFKCDLTDSKWLPKGTIMVTKEPYLKFATSAQGQVMLRVDSPSDVVFVDESDEKMLKNIGALKWFKKQSLTSQQLKLKGNEYFGKKEFDEALKWYKKALLVEPDSGVLHLNMSAALLCLERYCKAYEAAAKALQLGADKAKSLLRLGRAAYGMKNWELSLKHFQEFNRNFPSSQEAVLDLTRVQNRLKESRTGIYNLNYLAKEAVDKKIFFMDLADYTGPVVIDDIKGKGKGVIASKDIAKGTLLMVSKAFSISCGNEHPNIKLDAFNLISNMPSSKTETSNIIKTMQTLLHNPHKAKDFYSLCAGDLPREENVAAGVVDAQRIEKICTFNSFGVQTLFCVPRKEKDDIPCGLWILPSFLNHSCVANSFRVFCGDTMFVHAVENIKQGEEITISYLDAFEPYTERARKLENYGFRCTCELCAFDRSNKSNSTREQIWRQAEAIGNNTLNTMFPTLQVTRQLESLIQQIQTNKIHGQEINTLQFHPLTSLFFVHRSLGNMEKSLEILKQMLACCGETYIHIHGVQVLLWMADCNLALRNRQAAKENATLAMKINRVRMGGDKNLFKKIFPEAQKFL